MKLTKDEMISYVGGAGLSAAFVSAMLKMGLTLYTWGQTFGMTLRSIFKPYKC